MIKPVGGRGKKAPYETMQMRVPIPVKPFLEAIIERFRNGESIAINLNTGLSDSGTTNLNTGLQDDDQDDTEDDSYDDESEATDAEIIKSQADKNQSLLTEIKFLEKDLIKATEKINSCDNDRVRLEVQVKALKEENDKLWSEKKHSQDAIKSLLEKVDGKEKGYQSKNFSQGIKEIKKLI